jgi:hypothetical protein
MIDDLVANIDSVHFSSLTFCNILHLFRSACTVFSPLGPGIVSKLITKIRSLSLNKIDTERLHTLLYTFCDLKRLSPSLEPRLSDSIAQLTTNINQALSLSAQ